MIEMILFIIAMLITIIGAGILYLIENLWGE